MKLSEKKEKSRYIFPYYICELIDFFSNMRIWTGIFSEQPNK